MESKTCNNCKLEFPKTAEYFFPKKIKQKLADGRIVIYDSFRAYCKKCYAKKAHEKYVQNRCAEIGCDISEFELRTKEVRSERISKVKTIDMEAKSNLTEGQYNYYLKKKRTNDNYSWQNYLNDTTVNKHSKPWMRKYDYNGSVFLTKEEIRKKINSEKIKNITNSYIANKLRIPVQDMDKDIIETYRIIIQLKRELGIGNTITNRRKAQQN